MKRIVVTSSAAAVLAAALVAPLGGCGPASSSADASAAVAPDEHADAAARARQDSLNRTLPGYVVDSVFPIAEEVRRFRVAVGGPPARTLDGGAASRDELVRAIVAAAVARDSAALGRMALSAREFVDLVYPASPFAHPPSQEAPGRVWMTIQNPSRSGRARLLRHLGGLAVAYGGHACNPAPERQGLNRLWTRCTVALVAADGSQERHRLFGSIIERQGRFKVVSYTNEF